MKAPASRLTRRKVLVGAAAAGAAVLRPGVASGGAPFEGDRPSTSKDTDHQGNGTAHRFVPDDRHGGADVR